VSTTADKIRTLAAEGHSAPEIADRLRISAAWVRSCAKIHGIDMPAHRWPETVTAEALRNHTGTDAELARSLGVSRQAVSLARRRHGVPLSLLPSVQRGILAEVRRRAGHDADDHAWHEAKLAVMSDLNVWAEGVES
jgi:hypothetical protein